MPYSTRWFLKFVIWINIGEDFLPVGEVVINKNLLSNFNISFCKFMFKYLWFGDVEYNSNLLLIFTFNKHIFCTKNKFQINWLIRILPYLKTILSEDTYFIQSSTDPLAHYYKGMATIHAGKSKEWILQ